MRITDLNTLREVKDQIYFLRRFIYQLVQVKDISRFTHVEKTIYYVLVLLEEIETEGFFALVRQKTTSPKIRALQKIGATQILDERDILFSQLKDPLTNSLLWEKANEPIELSDEQAKVVLSVQGKLIQYTNAHIDLIQARVPGRLIYLSKPEVHKNILWYFIATAVTAFPMYVLKEFMPIFFLLSIFCLSLSILAFLRLGIVGFIEQSMNFSLNRRNPKESFTLMSIESMLYQHAQRNYPHTTRNFIILILVIGLPVLALIVAILLGSQ